MTSALSAVASDPGRALARAAGGDEAAFALLVRRHQEPRELVVLEVAPEELLATLDDCGERFR